MIWATYPEAIAVQDMNGNLPLHQLCSEIVDSNNTSNTLLLRFLVRNYPAGVSIPNNDGETAYSLICSNLPDKTLEHRIMLRVNPDLDVSTYCNLNYEARRLTNFLIFSASMVEYRVAKKVL